MTPEDEEFVRIEREAEIRAAPKRQWVGLTIDELIDLEQNHLSHAGLTKAIETKLKEKNHD